MGLPTRGGPLHLTVVSHEGELARPRQRCDRCAARLQDALTALSGGHGIPFTAIMRAHLPRRRRRRRLLLPLLHKPAPTPSFLPTPMGSIPLLLLLVTHRVSTARLHLDLHSSRSAADSPEARRHKELVTVTAPRAAILCVCTGLLPYSCERRQASALLLGACCTQVHTLPAAAAAGKGALSARRSVSSCGGCSPLLSAALAFALACV